MAETPKEKKKVGLLEDLATAQSLIFSLKAELSSLKVELNLAQAKNDKLQANVIMAKQVFDEILSRPRPVWSNAIRRMVSDVKQKMES